VKTELKHKSGEVILTITIPAKRVRDAFSEIKRAALKEVSVPGFRKGKAPATIAEKHLDEDKLSEALFNHLVPPAYARALKERKIKPIVPPQLRIISYRKDEDLVFEAKTAVKPPIELGNYKAALKKLKGKVIYGPNGKPIKGGPKVTAAQVLEKLREVVGLEVPPILVEREVQRMLSSLLRQVQTLGITIEQYLSAEGKTVDQLRKEYQQTAERNIKDEFIVSEIAQEEGIGVEDKEVDEAIAAAPDEKTRKAFSEEGGRQYIENILRKRKTIEFLLKVAEGTSG